MISKHKLLRLILSLTLLINFTVLEQKLAMAAPGDTFQVITNAVPALSGTAYSNGGLTSVASFRNNTVNTTYSNISLKNWGNMYVGTGSGPRTGYIYWSVRKNGVNGPILWESSINSFWVSSGEVYLGIPGSAVANVTLHPGESIHLVIEHGFSSGVGMYAYSPHGSNYKVDYWITDYLIQTGVDASKTAATNATNAMNAANAAYNNSWYSGAYGGASENVANLAGYIRNTQLPGIDTKITNLQTAVTNINNSIGNDTTAPVIKVKTVSGARATSAGSINVVISGADNKDPFTALQYSVNGGAYAPMPANGIINIPVNISPITTTTIAVKDSAGNIATELISIRKL